MADLGFWEKKSTGGGGSAPIGNLRVDVLFTTDNSGSMSAFQNWLFDPATAIALNDALVVNGIGAVNQDGLDTDNCNRIATSKYSQMLQLAYRDLVVAQVSQSISGVGVGDTNVQFTNGATNYSGYTVYAYNNRQYVNNFAPTSSNVSLSGDYIDFNNHKYGSGDRVVYSNGGGTSIGGLTDGTTYFVSRVNNNRFRLATTRANAIAGTGVVDLNTTEGSGSNHSFTGPFELILRETSGAGTTQDIPIGSSCSAGGTVDNFKRLEVPYKYYTPCDERIKYFWASNANGASFNPNTINAGQATTPLGSFVSGIQEDSYNTIYSSYAIVRDGGDDYRPRSGSKGIVVASSNQQSILSPAIPTTPGGSYQLTLDTLKDTNVSYVGMVGGYIASSLANRVEPYIRQAPDYGETGVPAADVRGFVPLTGAVKETGGLDYTTQTTATAGIMNSIPQGWYRNVLMTLKTAAATPNRIRADIRVNMYLSPTGTGGAIVVDPVSKVSIGGYGYEDGDILTVSPDSTELTGLANDLDITVATNGTEDEDYTGMSNVVIGGAFTPGEFRIITIDGFTSGGGGEATDRRVRELNFATFPDTNLGETGSFNSQSITPVSGRVAASNGKTINANATAGDKTLTLSSAAGVNVGDFVYDTTTSNSTLRVPYNTKVTAVDTSTNIITLSHPINENISSGDTAIRVGPLSTDDHGWDYERLARETNGALYFMPGPHYWSSSNVIGSSSSSPGVSSTQATDDWQTIAIFQTWKVTFGRSIGRVFGQYLFKTA